MAILAKFANNVSMSVSIDNMEEFIMLCYALEDDGLEYAVEFGDSVCDYLMHMDNCDAEEDPWDDVRSTHERNKRKHSRRRKDACTKEAHRRKDAVNVLASSSFAYQEFKDALNNAHYKNNGEYLSNFRYERVSDKRRLEMSDYKDCTCEEYTPCGDESAINIPDVLYVDIDGLKSASPYIRNLYNALNDSYSELSDAREEAYNKRLPTLWSKRCSDACDESKTISKELIAAYRVILNVE